MQKSILPIILFVIFAAGCQPPAPSSTISFKPIPVDYPTTEKDTSVIDNYHGKEIADPYRWLEDDNSPQTKAWVTSQNEVTFDYLKQIPYRKAIEDRLTKIWNYEKYGSPFKEGGKYYFFKNDGLQNQFVLYRQESLDAPAEVVLDPNTLSDDGTVSLGSISFSKDGRYLAYQLSEGGSDWRTCYVKDLETGQITEDKLEWLKFTGMSWYKNGFFYSRYPTPQEGDELSGKNEFQAVYYHTLGTPQSDDELIFADRTNPALGFFTGITEDERFLLLNAWESTSGNALYFKDLSQENSDFKAIVSEIEDDYSVIGNDEDRLFILTNNKASNQRLVAVSTSRPEAQYWEEILPEGKDVLESVYMIGGKLIGKYLHDAAGQVRVFDYNGKFISELGLPSIGSVGSFSGKKDDPMAFYSFTSFTQPTSIYKLNMESLKSEPFKTPDMDFKSDNYITKQVWFTSADGTKVPMFITHKKGLKMDGQRPTLLYGYGGFNISITPGFSLTRCIILENDGIYAVANIRGGGEFGKAWHKSGTLDQKQNVFNDFIGAAEYLIGENYTSSDKLGIQGGSNGGLLVGACMTQRPDLFGVALPAVGVLDMLRYHLFTIGKAWATDYGLSDDEKSFDYLLAYSPLHNVKKTNYPATLVTTADHDDRVVPAHSFKYIATLQEHQQGDNPVLIRIETSAGHGAGKPVSKQIEEATDWLSFMFYNLESDITYPY